MQEMNPPKGLLEKIINRIRREERLAVVRRRIVIFSVLSITSIMTFIPLFRIVGADFAASGFFQFFSLLFSDFQTIVTYWQSFAMSLLEVLPVMSLAFLFANVLFFLWSLRILTKDIKFVSRPTLINNKALA